MKTNDYGKDVPKNPAKQIPVPVRAEYNCVFSTHTEVSIQKAMEKLYDAMSKSNVQILAAKTPRTTVEHLMNILTDIHNIQKGLK